MNQELEIGLGKKSRRAYGFDEIALVPAGNTLDIELTDTTWKLAGFKFETPIIASAMDSVVSPDNASIILDHGAFAVLNLNGIYTRYENYKEILEQIIQADKSSFVELMQKLYKEPIKPDLIKKVISKIKADLKDKSKPVAVSILPYQANEWYQTLEEAGVDILVIQSTVIGLKHESINPANQLDLKDFCVKTKLPVVVGNCVDYNIALKLMDTGIAGLLVGIGPGAACTSRGVLGIGVPMATTIADCRKARDDYFAKSNRYIPIVADGGMAGGGDICKALACGADAVMIGSPFARTKEAPAKGFHWGMATPSPVLPRGTRIQVGTDSSLQELLYGPASRDDGSQNLVGAIKTSMATLGAHNLKEMQDVEVIVAPSILSEGKVYQQAQKLGMGR
ncbi:MAG: GuaB3 family IMP dehydrogenase-related protein [Candidatus Caenarcaniphilales bacterium]|jgi:IMP dehydrogenase|nr:GuaB3 family IMP dehydrogenase-related protein [Candidatus Caenarcaniphilales bacterium]